MWPCSSMLRTLLRRLCLSIALFRPCGSDCCAVKISAGCLLGVSGLYMTLAVLQQQADPWWHCFAATGLTVPLRTCMV